MRIFRGYLELTPAAEAALADAGAELNYNEAVGMYDSVVINDSRHYGVGYIDGDAETPHYMFVPGENRHKPDFVF